MSSTVLNTLLRHLVTLARAIRGCDLMARLRFCLSFLQSRMWRRRKDTTTWARQSTVARDVDVFCSTVPPSIKLEVPETGINALAPPSAQSPSSSRAPSIRTIRSHQSAEGIEEMRTRARAISASQREDRAVQSQWARVAIASRPQSRTSAASASAPASHRNSPARSAFSLSRPASPSASQAMTPSSLYPPQDPHARRTDSPLGEGYGVSSISGHSSSFSRDRVPTLEINTIDVQPPSQSTSPGSSRLGSDGASTEGDALSRANESTPSVQQSLIESSCARSAHPLYPPLPPLPPNRWIVEVTPKDLPWYARRATT